MSAKRWGVAAGDVEHWTSFADVVAGAPLAQEAGGDDGISLSDTHDKEPRALKLSTTTKLAVRQTLDDATTRHRLAELSEKLDADRRAYSSERCWSFGPADVISKARSEAAAVQKKSMPKLKHLRTLKDGEKLAKLTASHSCEEPKKKLQSLRPSLFTSAAVPELESVPAPALIDLDAEHLVTIRGMVSNLLNA